MTGVAVCHIMTVPKGKLLAVMVLKLAVAVGHALLKVVAESIGAPVDVALQGIPQVLIDTTMAAVGL